VTEPWSRTILLQSYWKSSTTGLRLGERMSQEAKAPYAARMILPPFSALGAAGRRAAIIASVALLAACAGASPSPDAPSLVQAPVAPAPDCDWDPSPSEDRGPDPLSCDLEFEQSCVPDPCFDEGERDCKPACKKTCTDCASSCKKSCGACKAACTDDACRSACAGHCGTCREACVQAKDQCTSGTCGQRYRACNKKMAEDWKKGGCAGVCPAVAQCVQACTPDPSGSMDACVGRCKTRMKGCPARFYGMCVMGATPTD
jgi:hypothetical protein